MPYRANQDVSYVGLGGELTAAEELRVQEIQALSDTAADEALGKLSGSVVKKAVAGGDNYTLPTAAADTLGGIKVGARLSIADGVLSADEQTGEGSMVYPGAGIPLSTGEAWGTSITNNSANWNTAYGWGNHATAGYVTGTPWTAEGYLTALTGAVLTDQTTPQTIGLTGSRLAKLWATDITCTNTIAGDITGNAGTATNGATSSAVIADNAIVRGDGGAKGVQSSPVTMADDGTTVIPNNISFTFAGGVGHNNNSFKSGDDGNFLFDIGADNDTRIKLGDNGGTNFFDLADSDWASIFKVDSNGNSVQSGTAQASNIASGASVSGTNTGDETTYTIKTKLGAATTEADGYATSTQIAKLGGIDEGAEVNNISDVNATDLTDGGATTLHKHSYNNLDDKPTIPTLPVKASGAEIDTGEDDAKFATAKALKDSHNVPSVTPGTSGNVLTSDGTDWTSAAPAGGSSKQLIAMGAAISSPASTTYYISGMTGTALGTSATANGIEWIVPLAGTLKKFYLFSYETLNGTAGQTIVFEIWKNNATTGVKVTQTVGETSRIYSDTTNTVAVSAGDKICIKVITGAITANSGRMSGGGIEFDPS